MRPTEIIAVQVEPYDLPLPTPFETAQARRTTAQNLLITLELAGGTRGVAEVAPTPHVTGEDQAGSLQLLESAARELLGADAAHYRAISNQFREAYPQAHAARAGLEGALLDAYCQYLGVPLVHFFGGAQTEVVSDITIPIVPPLRAAEVARSAVRQGFQDLKVKTGEFAEGLARVIAVAQAAPSARIRIDGNQGLTREEAVRMVEHALAARVNLTLLEQPVPREDLEGLRFVRERIPVPLAADESVITPEDAYRVARAEAVDVVNIKLMKAGVLGAMEIAAICRAAGIRLMLGCMLESRVGISIAAHLATGLGVFEFLDLDGHLLTGDTRSAGGFAQTGGRIIPEVGEPGHGVCFP